MYPKRTFSRQACIPSTYLNALSVRLASALHSTVIDERKRAFRMQEV